MMNSAYTAFAIFSVNEMEGGNGSIYRSRSGNKDGDERVVVSVNFLQPSHSLQYTETAQHTKPFNPENRSYVLDAGCENLRTSLKLRFPK
jgi:hypothetical protein